MSLLIQPMPLDRGDQCVFVELLVDLIRQQPPRYGYGRSELTALMRLSAQREEKGCHVQLGKKAEFWNAIGSSAFQGSTVVENHRLKNKSRDFIITNK